MGERLGELAIEAAPVQQAGQRVVLGEVAQAVLMALAVRDVAHDRHDEILPAELERTERDVDRALRAVRATAAQLEVLAHRTPPGGGVVAGAMAVMALGERRRDERVDGAPGERTRRIGEQVLGARVGKPDRAEGIDHEHRLGRRLEELRDHLGLRSFVADGYGRYVQVLVP